MVEFKDDLVSVNYQLINSVNIPPIDRLLFILLIQFIHCFCCQV